MIEVQNDGDGGGERGERGVEDVTIVCIEGEEEEEEEEEEVGTADITELNTGGYIAISELGSLETGIISVVITVH